MSMLGGRLSWLNRIAFHDARNRRLIVSQIRNVRATRLRRADETQSVALLRSLLETRNVLRKYRGILERKVERQMDLGTRRSETRAG